MPQIPLIQTYQIRMIKLEEQMETLVSNPKLVKKKKNNILGFNFLFIFFQLYQI